MLEISLITIPRPNIRYYFVFCHCSVLVSTFSRWLMWPVKKNTIHYHFINLFYSSPGGYGNTIESKISELLRLGRIKRTKVSNFIHYFSTT
jgi:hypothetical protein